MHIPLRDLFHSVGGPCMVSLTCVFSRFSTITAITDLYSGSSLLHPRKSGRHLFHLALDVLEVLESIASNFK